MYGQNAPPYSLVILLSVVIAGISFLGYEHVLDGQTIGTLFGSIITGAAVGHYVTKGNPNG